MTTSPQARAVRAWLSAVPDAAIARLITHPPRRAWPAFVPPWLERGYDVQVRAVGAGQVAVAAPRSGNGRHLFYLHGGAYTLKPAHWGFAKGFLDDGWTVSMVDYPLAPEHGVDTTVSMVLEAWSETTHRSPGSVDLAGDSAGGGLALVLLQRARDLGLPRPGRTVLFSPWVDLVMDDPVTVAAAATDPLLSLPGLRGAARLYASGRDLADPLLSPLHGGLDDLGAIQAWVGTREMFLSQCCVLADRAAIADGTDLELRIGHGLVHDWPMFPIPEGRRALAEAKAFLGLGG